MPTADRTSTVALVEHVDSIAEIPNALRNRTPVRLTGAAVGSG
jgi:hypothetical protein